LSLSVAHLADAAGGSDGPNFIQKTANHVPVNSELARDPALAERVAITKVQSSRAVLLVSIAADVLVPLLTSLRGTGSTSTLGDALAKCLVTSFVRSGFLEEPLAGGRSLLLLEFGALLGRGLLEQLARLRIAVVELGPQVAKDLSAF
jgi:hypothetical protein